MNEKITAPLVRSLKGTRKLTVLTAYDYSMAKMVDQSGMDMVLVGDSLAMVVLGLEDTLSITLDEMIHHCRPVSRAVKRALVVGDMPFLSYEAGVEQAILNAGRMVKEGGVRAVKLEGAGRVLPQVRALVGAGIPVMGHIGLTPQRMAEMGGFKVQGKSVEAAEKLASEALELAEAGCFSIVLEGMPAPLAERITAATPRAHHRHRRGAPLRRPGAGHQRHPRALRPFCSEIRQTIRQAVAPHRRGPGGVQTGSGVRGVPR